MLELTDMHIPLDAMLPGNEELLFRAAAERLGVPRNNISTLRIAKKSVDARKKSNVHFVMTLMVSLASESLEMNVLSRLNVEQGNDLLISRTSDHRFPLLAPNTKAGTGVKTALSLEGLVVPSIPDSLLAPGFQRPVVVGSGPAGLFAALYLAKSGLRPLVLERGAAMDDRVSAVDSFNAGGGFDPVTNIQFGEGGAGTFSDGKLTTNTKNPLCRTVLEWFHEAGAPEEILIDAKPHIGTDKLRGVVKNMRQQIERFGGEVRFNTQVVDLTFTNGAVSAVETLNTVTGQTESVSATHVILATGHSARDTFAMLNKNGLTMERKPFSLGVRIEHPQALVNEAQYGSACSHPALGAADYKLSTHLSNGRGVYTFCMCPGGQVVAAASEEGGVVVNGMSVHARDGENANSAVLVSVEPSDFPGDGVLAGVEFQRTWERAAYNLAVRNGGAPYSAPAQRVGDFLKGKKKGGASAECGPVSPSYPRGVTWSDLHECLPEFISESLEQALPQFDRKLKGFAHPNAVMTGVETRSSSPVRVVRDKETFQASFACASEDVALTGVYPCGEGAGYAGGIMSAAVDGLKVARALTQQVCSVDLTLVAGASLRVRGELIKGIDGSANISAKPVSDSRWYADDQGNRYKYQLLSDDTVRILECEIVSSAVIMPAFIDNLLVSEVAGRAFMGTKGVLSIQLPPGVRRIESGLLCYLQSLKELALPDAVTTLDITVLQTVKEIEVLRLPSMLMRVPAGMFRGSCLRELYLGKSTEHVVDCAFEQSHLEKISVDPSNPWLYSDGLALYRKEDNALVALAVPVDRYQVLPGCTRICRKAFAGMGGVAYVDLPDSVEVIEPFAFFKSGIVEFNAPAGLKKIDEKAFFQCANLQHANLNEGLVSLGAEAFERSGVRSIYLPSTLTSVGMSFCGEVREEDGYLVPKITLNPSNPTFFMDDQQGLYHRHGAKLSFAGLLNGAARTYTLHPDTVAIEPNAFARQRNLTLVELSEGLQSIADNAFNGCISLGCVEGSTALESVGANAFASTSLQQFHIPRTLKYLGRNALIIRETNNRVIPAAVPRITADPDCHRFFVEDGFLCERAGEDEIVAILYCGPGGHIVVPDCVTVIRTYCMVNVQRVDALELHDGIRLYELNCFQCEPYVETVIMNLRNKPLEGHDRLVFRFSDIDVGKHALRQAFAPSSAENTPTINATGVGGRGGGVVDGDSRSSVGFSDPLSDLVNLNQAIISQSTGNMSGSFNPNRVFASADESMFWSPNTFKMARAALERLTDPIFLSDGARARFVSTVSQRLGDVVVSFAKTNYLQGFDQLIECGLITQDNIVVITDMVGETANVEATGHLFELRRRYFGYDVMAEFDL